MPPFGVQAPAGSIYVETHSAMNYDPQLVELQAAIYRQTRPRRGRSSTCSPRSPTARICKPPGCGGSSAAGATPGVNGVTAADIGARHARWLAAGRRSPACPLPTGLPALGRIPKPRRAGATRRLGVLTLRDRIVHAAVKQVLDPLFDPTFSPQSLGFVAAVRWPPPRRAC